MSKRKYECGDPLSPIQLILSLIEGRTVYDKLAERATNAEFLRNWPLNSLLECTQHGRFCTAVRIP